jgi:hypothetical protein
MNTVGVKTLFIFFVQHSHVLGKILLVCQCVPGHEELSLNAAHVLGTDGVP